jgi:hypothetical protein
MTSLNPKKKLESEKRLQDALTALRENQIHSIRAAATHFEVSYLIL